MCACARGWVAGCGWVGVGVGVGGWLAGWVWVGGWVSVCVLRELLRYLREHLQFGLQCCRVTAAHMFPGHKLRVAEELHLCSCSL